MFTTISSTVLVQGLHEPNNEPAWRQFSARYETMLFAFACRAGLRDADARDVVQETLVAFLEDFRQGKFDRQKGRLRSWLQGIAFNRIKRARHRLAKREVQVAESTSATGFMNRVPDDHELTDIFDAEWRRAVAAECMQEARRESDAKTFRAFELYALKARPAEEVAEHLGMSRNAVYISKTRVLSRLRELGPKIAEVW
ncbi:MAG: sigma-70 family RNA polymerase sigma factor [Planctomycetota bacterium]